MALQKFKTIRHYHEPGDCHELTFSCYGRLPLLTNEDWRLSLAESIDKALEAHSLNLSAYVFMPEHVHLLVWPSDPTFCPVSKFLQTLKQSHSSKIKAKLRRENSPLLQKLMVQERPGKTAFRYWQEGPGYDRNLNSLEAIRLSIDYFHNNPVNRELCKRAIDWLWSSARHYIEVPEYPPLKVPHWSPLPAEFLMGMKCS